MTTKQIIKERLEHLTEEQLNQINQAISELTGNQDSVKPPSLMSKLTKVKIEAAENFSIQVGASLGRDVSEG
jgi:hypothetical protein